MVIIVLCFAFAFISSASAAPVVVRDDDAAPLITAQGGGGEVADKSHVAPSIGLRIRLRLGIRGGILLLLLPIVVVVVGVAAVRHVLSDHNRHAAPLRPNGGGMGIVGGAPNAEGRRRQRCGVIVRRRLRGRAQHHRRGNEWGVAAGVAGAVKLQNIIRREALSFAFALPSSSCSRPINNGTPQVIRRGRGGVGRRPHTAAAEIVRAAKYSQTTAAAAEEQMGGRGQRLRAAGVGHPHRAAHRRRAVDTARQRTNCCAVERTAERRSPIVARSALISDQLNGEGGRKGWAAVAA